MPSAWWALSRRSLFFFFFFCWHGMWSSSVLGIMTISQDLNEIAATLVCSYFDVLYYSRFIPQSQNFPR
jgi:hypothetical protein